MNMDERPLVQFAEPGQSLSGPHPVQRNKNKILNQLWAGDSLQEAVNRLGLSMQQVAKWRMHDAEFSQRVDRELDRQRIEFMPVLEENVMSQAMEPTLGGAKLALQVLERWQPERWGKTSNITLNDKRDSPLNKHLGDYMDDPVILDAEYTEKPADE